MKKLLLRLLFSFFMCQSVTMPQFLHNSPISFFYLTSESSYLTEVPISVKLWGGYESGSQYKFKLYKIDQPESKLIKQIPKYLSYPFESILSIRPEYAKVIKSWHEDIIFNASDNDTVSVEIGLGEIQEPGLYQLQVSAQYKSAYLNFAVTNYGLTIKAIGKKYLCFVSNLKSGEFENNCELNFYFNDELLYKKNTGNSGILIDALPDTLFPYLNDKMILIVGKVKGHYIVSRPILEYEDYKLVSPELFSIKDKDHYEPGDSIKYVGIFRELKPEGVSLPSFDRVYKDEDYYKWDADSTAVKLNEYGIINQSFKIDTPSNPILYSINWRMHPEQMTWDDRPFSIRVKNNPVENLNNERLTISLSQKTYLPKEIIEGKVKYFNTNSSKLDSDDIKVWIYRKPYNIPWWIDDELSGLLSLEYGKQNPHRVFKYESDSISGKLDHNGEFNFKYIPAENNADDFIYEFYTKLVDGRKYSLGAVCTTLVSRGSALLNITSEKKIYLRGEPVIFNLKVKTLDRTNYSFKYKIYVSSLMDSAGSRVEDKNIFFYEGKTDSNGKASVKFSPANYGNNSYAATVIVADKDGNEITERIEIPIYPSINDSINDVPMIFTDKEYYSPGDTMNLWIDFPTEHFLLTFERGLILAQKKINNGSQRQFFRIVIDTLLTPDFIINVYGILNGKYLYDEKIIKVLSKHKFLALDIKTDKDEYVSLDNVKAIVTVTDQYNNPVKNADVTIAVKSKHNPYLLDYGKRTINEIFYHDLAAWYYRTRIFTGIDSTINLNSPDKIKTFDEMYPEKKYDRRRNKKYTVYYKKNNWESDPYTDRFLYREVTLSGNGREINIPYHVDFDPEISRLDSFYMVTEGYYDLYLNDESINHSGLLNKNQNQNNSDLNYYIGAYYINSDTTLIIDYKNFSEWLIVNTNNFNNRSNFRSSYDYQFGFRLDNIFDEWTGIFRDSPQVENQYNAFWKTNLRTDENGVVKFSFVIPEKDAEWFISAYAVTKDSKVGERKIPLKTNHPVLIKNTHAEYLNQGDISTIRTSIKNNSNQVLNAEIKIEIKGAVLLSGYSGYQQDVSEEDVRQNEYTSITVPGGSELFFEWEICVDDSTELVNYSVTINYQGQTTINRDSLRVIQKQKDTEIVVSDVTTDINYNNEFIIDLSKIELEKDIKLKILLMPSMPATISLARSRFNSSLLSSNIDFASRLLIDTSYKQLYKILSKNYSQYKWNFDSTILYKQYESGHTLQNANVCGWFNSLSADPYTTAFIMFANSQKEPKDYAHNIFNLVQRYYNIEEYFNKKQPGKKYSFDFPLFAMEQYKARHKIDFNTVHNHKKELPDLEPAKDLGNLFVADDLFKKVLTELQKLYNKRSYHSENSINDAVDSILTTKENLSSITKTNPFNGQRVLLTYFLMKLLYLKESNDISADHLLFDIINNVNENYSHSPFYNSLLVSAIRNYLEYYPLEVPSYWISISVNDEIIFEYNYKSVSDFENLTSVSVPDELVKKYLGKKLKIKISKDGEGYFHYNIVKNIRKSIQEEEVNNPEIQIAKKYLRIIDETRDDIVRYEIEEESAELIFGDYLLVETTVTLPEGDHSYFVVEESLPPGFSMVKNQSSMFSSLHLPKNLSDSEFYLEFLDNKLKFYYPNATSKIHLRYLIKADLPGKVYVPPTKAYFEYKPFLKSYSKEYMLIITRD